jgi:NADH dehydrogenase FAD-containing subunit
MNLVILGGGYGGVACATRLAHLARGAARSLDVTLVNDCDRFIERIRLHQAAAGQNVHEHALSPLLERAGVRFITGRAERIDLKARNVKVGGRLLEWDRLVLALGSRAGRFDIPGAARHAVGLNPRQTAALAARLNRLSSGASIAVVGGGLTGIEAATEIRESHPRLRVRLYSRGRLAHEWSAEARTYLLDALARLGVELHEGLEVREVDEGRLHTSEGERPFDACVWTTGFEISRLARESGLAVNPAGQVRVDPTLRSVSHPEVYAAGDIASPVLDPGHALPMGCKSALPTGAHVGENLACELAGLEPAAFDFGMTFFCVSLGRRDGLIQWPDAEGRPLGRIVTGEEGARFKEMVCAQTWHWLVQEASGARAIKWRRTGHAPGRLPAAQLATLEA